jgi:amidase
MKLQRRTFLGGALAAATGASWRGLAAGQPGYFHLQEATLGSVSAGLRSGALTSELLVGLYLARIAAYEDAGPRLNSIITLNRDALTTAAALDAERKAKGPRGPLHGVPVLLKDNIDTVDMPTSNGSVILKAAMAPDDAYIARSLRAAGAVILGKASMGEFAGNSYNSLSGQAINPYHFKRQTGGSSSGSGCAIAANLAMLAVGTDTSTSVRGPASFNGICGMRPTTGLISRDGIAPKNLNFDSAGPMARTVTDLAHLLSVIAGSDPADGLNQTVWAEMAKRQPQRVKQGHVDFSAFLDRKALKGARLGVVRDFFGGDPQIDALAEAALATLQAAGAHLVDVRLPRKILDDYLGKGGQRIRRISDFRFRGDWEKYLATLDPASPKTVAQMVEIYETQVMKSPLPVEASVMRLLKDSLQTSPDDPQYKVLLAETLPAATRDKLALFAEHEVDAMVFPYATSFAAPIDNPAYQVADPTFVDSDRPQAAILSGYSSVGFPGIVVPMGFGDQGLPMTLAFFGRPYEDGRLIGLAYAYEQASLKRRPSSLLPPLAGESIEIG